MNVYVFKMRDGIRMGNLLGEQIDKKVSQVISFHFREKADSLLHLCRLLTFYFLLILI